MKKLMVIGAFTLGLMTIVQASTYLSPEYLAASKDGQTLYVTGATSQQLVLARAADARKIGAWKLPVQPTGVATAKDGSVYVTGGSSDGILVRYSADGKKTGEVKVGHTPMSPLVSSDGKSVYVANRFDTTVMKIDTAAMKVVQTIKVLREPHGLAFGAGEKILFVANHLPYCRATDDVVAAAVSMVDLATGKVSNTLLPNGSTGVRGICASPDGTSVYVTHTFGRYLLPTTQLERGWMNTAAMSVFNGTTGKYINTVLLDDVDLGAANPWGVSVSADGKKIAVAHAGSREISVIDRIALESKLARAAKNEQVTEVSGSASRVPNDLSFMADIRKRFPMDGDGPRGVLFIGSKIYTALYFADALGGLDIALAKPVVSKYALAPAPDLSKDRLRRGEMLWNDGTMCFQQWQSCASCHPDGRADCLNWDLLNDGMGNAKQSKNLVYCHLTPPAMVTGIRPGMKACNRAGLIHIQFVNRPEEDGLCLDEFVIAMKPVESPELVTGPGSRKVLSAAAKRGEKLFDKAGCVICHTPAKVDGKALFTDLRKHDVGLGTLDEVGEKFDTPTLVECWRTAPYLYDGRALTIEEVLTTCNPKNTHGMTKGMTKQEIADLAAYVRSL